MRPNKNICGRDIFNCGIVLLTTLELVLHDIGRKRVEFLPNYIKRFYLHQVQSFYCILPFRTQKYNGSFSKQHIKVKINFWNLQIFIFWWIKSYNKLFIFFKYKQIHTKLSLINSYQPENFPLLLSVVMWYRIPYSSDFVKILLNFLVILIVFVFIRRELIKIIYLAIKERIGPKQRLN